MSLLWLLFLVLITVGIAGGVAVIVAKADREREVALWTPLLADL